MRNKVQELGSLLNDILMNPDEPSNPQRMRKINETATQYAMRLAGVTSADLRDEEQEDSPRVRLFWAYSSLLLGQVYSEAANQLTYTEGWNDLP